MSACESGGECLRPSPVDSQFKWVLFRRPSCRNQPSRMRAVTKKLRMRRESPAVKLSHPSWNYYTVIQLDLQQTLDIDLPIGTAKVVSHYRL